MLNHIDIGGRLTRDPELRYTQSQVAVCSFSVAVERDYAPQGQQKETDFFDCVVWRQGAEFVSKYFHKGDMILVGGRMQSRKYTESSAVSGRLPLKTHTSAAAKRTAAAVEARARPTTTPIRASTVRRPLPQLPNRSSSSSSSPSWMTMTENCPSEEV